MHKNITIIFSILVLLTSCSDSKIEFEEIKPNFVAEPIKVIDLADDFYAIEIKSEVPIGQMPTILADDNHIYLFDREASQSLFKIDYNGSILASVRFEEDDMLNIHGITSLILVEGRVGVITLGEKVNWFDENLELTGSEKLPARGNFQLPFKNGFVSHNSSINEAEPWDFFYSEDTIQIRDIPYTPSQHRFTYQATAPFTNWRNSLLFSVMLNDTIYSFDGLSKLQRVLSVDFGSKKIPKNFLETISHPLELLTFFNEGKYTYLEGNIFTLSDSNILLEINDQKKRKLGMWDMEANSIDVYPAILDTSVSGLAFFNPAWGENGTLVFGYSGDYVANKKNSLLPSFKSSLSSDYESSYFIFVMNLKK